MSTVSPLPIPATQESVFKRHSRQSSIDSQSDVLDPSSAESDNEDTDAYSDGQIEELYREEDDALRDNKFRSLTGSSPRVNSSRLSSASASRERKHSVEEIVHQAQQSSHLAPPGGQGDAASSSNGTGAGDEHSHQQQAAVSSSSSSSPLTVSLNGTGGGGDDGDLDHHMGPSGHGFPNQEEYDRALLHGSLSDDDYDDDGHLDFDDHRGNDLDLDVDTEDESCSEDGSSESDEDDWGRILQRPCDVRKVAPLGVDVASPKYDGRTSQEFLEALSPRFENTVPHSPRPNIRSKEEKAKIAKAERKRSVTFNEQTMTLLSSGETQLSPLIDEEEDPFDPHSPNYADQHWNGQGYDDDDLAMQYSSTGHHMQGQFPTIQVSDIDSPHSDDDAKRNEELQKISIPVCLEAISTLEKKLRLSADKLADTRSQLDDAKQQLEEKHEAYSEQEGRIADLQKELDGLREKMADVEKSADEAKKAREAAAAELESQKQMMKLQDTTLERMKSTMALKTEKLEQVEEAHQVELKRAKETLQKESAELRTRNTKLTKDNKELRAQLAHLLSNTRALRDSYSRVRTSLHTQAEAQKILNGTTRSTKPRSEWDNGAEAAAASTSATTTRKAAAGKSTRPSSLHRRNGTTPTRRHEKQQHQQASAFWSVFLPAAAFAMGVLAKTMAGRS